MRRIWVSALALMLGGCMVGPNYHRPGAIVPDAYKEAPGWTKAVPADNTVKGPWWKTYHDPVLNRLEPLVTVSNQTLAADYAAYQQSEAIVREVRGGLFPAVGLIGSAKRFGQGSSAPQSSGSLEGNVSWVPDIWGKIRRQVQSEKAAQQASAAELANATLSVQAALAGDYVNLRAQDATIDLLQQTVAAYQQSLQITENQANAGVATPLDVITARAQLEGAQAQLINAGVARAQYEHAIAVLVGKPPADLTLAPGQLIAQIPKIPAGVPSTLLERRPDIAAAERSMAQANAQIGVAVGAFYPDLSLSALGGFSASPIGGLFSASNALWSLGTDAAATLFEGGSRRAAVSAAWSGYEQSVAIYRQTVLTAFQQVEDALSNLRILAQQAEAEQAAVKDARQAVQIALNEYQAGTQAYTTVVTAQITLLADQQAALAVQQGRLLASIALIQGLGGGWQRADLPNDAPHIPE
jgi:NodT family efflux transporter outer membrane factor (OMF) lipoprotein